MKKASLEMYSSKVMPTWCAGCGDFNIWMAIKKALVNLNIFPHEVLFVFDVGCNGNMSDKIGAYRFHSLHGRVVPLCTGASLANRNIKVIGFAGDGGAYGEGVNHLFHAFRSNYDFTLIIHNNGNYGLTTGQATSTTKKKQVMSAAPSGVVEDDFDPIDFAFSMPSSFIAREFSEDLNGLITVFEEAIKHNGLSYIDVIQSCPTYDKGQLYGYFHERKKNVENIEGCDINNRKIMRDICLDRQKHIPVGVLYQDPESEAFYDRLVSRKGIPTEICEEVKKYEISKLLSHLR